MTIKTIKQALQLVQRLAQEVPEVTGGALFDNDSRGGLNVNNGEFRNQITVRAGRSYTGYSTYPHNRPEQPYQIELKAPEVVRSFGSGYSHWNDKTIVFRRNDKTHTFNEKGIKAAIERLAKMMIEAAARRAESKDHQKEQLSKQESTKLLLGLAHTTQRVSNLASGLIADVAVQYGGDRVKITFDLDIAKAQELLKQLELTP